MEHHIGASNGNPVDGVVQIPGAVLILTLEKMMKQYAWFCGFQVMPKIGHTG